MFLGNLLLPDTTILPGVKNLGLVVKSWNNNDNDDDDYYYYISKLVLSYWKCNNNNNIDNNNNNNDNNDYYYYYISTLVCALWLVNLAGRTLLHDPLKCVIYHLESVRYQQRHNLLPYMIYIFSILSLQCITKKMRQGLICPKRLVPEVNIQNVQCLLFLTFCLIHDAE